MLLRTLSVMLVAAMFPPPASGKELSPEEDADLTRRFIASQRSLRTYRAEFEQSLSLLGLRNPSVSKGTFSYRAPDDVRIDYSQPAGDFFLLRGEQFHLAKNGNPPRSYPATDRSARVLVALRKIMGGRTEAGAGMVRKVRREGSDYVVTLTPETPSRDVPERIENRIDAGSLALKRMTVTLPRGTSMEFSFSNPERNAKVDEKLFEQP
jgi:outer membrane lipoprotein-sorting protein